MVFLLSASYVSGELRLTVVAPSDLSNGVHPPVERIRRPWRSFSDRIGVLLRMSTGPDVKFMTTRTPCCAASRCNSGTAWRISCQVRMPTHGSAPPDGALARLHTGRSTGLYWLRIDPASARPDPTALRVSSAFARDSLQRNFTFTRPLVRCSISCAHHISESARGPLGGPRSAYFRT